MGVLMVMTAPEPDEKLVDHLTRPYSAVSRKDSPFGFVAGLMGTVGLGIVVFITMSAGRHGRAEATVMPPPPASAPPGSGLAPSPFQPSMSPSPQMPAPVMSPTQTAPQGIDEQQRLRAPAVVVDLSEASDGSPTSLVPVTSSGSVAQNSGTQSTPQGAVSAAISGGKSSGSPTAQRLAGDEGFAERVAGEQVDTAHATRLSNPAMIATQGTVISAVLETGINSDLPGFVRAVVSRDVSGFDGSTVLIPRGSKLIGEYKSGVAVGQSRAFVIWSRLLTPQGVSIQISSPATDRLGRGGLDGETNTHFVRRFGAAILLSVISAGLDALANQGSSGGVNAIVVGSPQQATSVATVALQRDIDIPPTITVPQGKSIRVFVARDLDFSSVYP